MNKKYSALCQLLCVAILSGCTPFVHKYGYNYENFNLKNITVGTDTTDTVLDKMGSPSSKAAFPTDPKNGGSKWFYISKKTATSAFFKPETTDQQTIVIFFNNKNIVTDIKTIVGESDVPLNTEETESTGYHSNTLRDVFGTFGRYSGKKRSGDDSGRAD